MLQVVLEVLEGNVRKGSQVYEEGHVSDLPFLVVALLLSSYRTYLPCGQHSDHISGHGICLADCRPLLVPVSI